MLFDTAVKENPEDFYNYRNELHEVREALKIGERLIVVKGPRRVGKTSLLRVVYNSLHTPKAWIDGRKIFAGVSVEGLLYDAFLSLLQQLKVEERLLARVESLSAGGFGARVRLPLPARLAEEADSELKKRKTTGTLFIDEAQLLKQYHADRFLAYVYDTLPGIRLVVAGSQIGLLEDFVGRSAKAPLFGRAKIEIEMKRLQREQALLFLQKGFREAGKKPSPKEIENAVSTVDGLIGWLTYYGYYRRRYPHSKSIELLRRDAQEITSSEIESFLASVKGVKRRYVILLKTLARGPFGWQELKTSLEIKERKAISDSRLQEYLSKLLAYSFIEKSGDQYTLSDPLVKEALNV